MTTREITRAEHADPVKSSEDDLFDYYLETAPDGRHDVHVAGPRKGCQAEAVIYHGFASLSSALFWIGVHAASVDLAEFTVLRASRAMHQWARRARIRLDESLVERPADHGGLVLPG